MTEVLRIASIGAWLVWAVTACSVPSRCDVTPGTTTPAAPQVSAESLYLDLGRVGLDPARVYRVRGASFNRASVHISLDDGTIAFTRDVLGHITGAFYEGDGEVLLMPPDRVERSSMALFTGAAILEERFGSAYLRFNDNTFSELQPFLREAENAKEFVSQWDTTARNLAEADSFRLLLTFSQFLPDSSGRGRSASPDDRMLHARLQGRKLGTFDVYFDSTGAEQVWAGQLRTVEGNSYYDVWTAFAPRRQRGPDEKALTSITGEENSAGFVRLTDYRIRAEVQPPSHLNAEAEVQVDVRSGGERALVFQLSRVLEIKKVEEDGRPVEFVHNPAVEGSQLSRRGNDLVAVIFPEPLRAGQKLQLRFVYGGDVLATAGPGLLYVGARGMWYPNRGLEMSNFDLQFRYPIGWTLLATGKRVDSAGEQANLAEGQQLSHWVSERPIPIAGFNLGKYERAMAHAGNVKVDTYATANVERAFPKAPPQAVVAEIPPSPGAPPGARQQMVAISPPPPSPARNAQPVADKSAEAINFFSRSFGPYPFSALALTQMPGPLSQGWPGLIFLSSWSFLTPAERTQLHVSDTNAILSDSVVAHETAHQWWGDLVVWSGYRDQWLIEGLANYSSMMLLEKKDPAQFHAVMSAYRDELLEKNKEGEPLMNAGPVTLGNRLSSSHFPQGYDAISYGRGTWLFHMLRSMMRDAEPPAKSAASNQDEPFIRGLRNLRQKYEGKPITTLDVLHAFEDELPQPLWYEGKKSLDWFYEGWVNGTAIPSFQLSGMKYTDKAGSTIVSGTIRQNSAAPELVTSVPIYASFGPAKTVLLGRVFVEGTESTFRLQAPAGTRKVVLDPNATVLSRKH